MARLNVTIVLAGFILFSACQVPLTDPAVQATGSITGTVHYNGTSGNSGIIVSAESTSKGISASVAGVMAGSRSAGSARSIAAQTQTDAAGSYTLSGLGSGTYTVYASCPSSLEKAVTTSVTVAAGKTATATDLSLTPTGAIAGTVTLGSATHGNLGIMVYVAGTSYFAMTADDGAFVISEVPAATGLALVASMSGFDSYVASVSVTAGAVTQAGTINLSAHTVPSTTGSVAGTATLRGSAAGNAGIFVYLAGTSSITLTADNGSFILAGVAPGEYTLTASKEGYSPATAHVVVSAGVTAPAGSLVLAPSAVAATGISVTPTSLALSPGEMLPLTASLSPANATNTGLTWQSSNTAVATVTAYGLVKGVSLGTTTITVVASDGGWSAPCAVTVRYVIGDTGPAGGLIFYDKGALSNGWRYLEAAPCDLTASIQWNNGSSIAVSTLTTIGSGKSNTANIIAAQGLGAMWYAASLCSSGYGGGGVNDWFLPSYDELSALYTNLASRGLGAFATGTYWSSTQVTNSTARVVIMPGGYNSTLNTGLSYYVRAIRQF
jgi:hypothetical protein